MALEDFTTYTEDDTSNSLTVTSTTITFSGLLRLDNSRVYKFFGVDYFVNYSVQFDFEITSDSGSPATVIIAGVSNTDTTIGSANPKLNFVAYNDGTGLKIGTSDATANSNFYTASYSTRYFVTMEKNGTSLVSRIYSDAGRTILLGTTNQTVSDTDTYSYFYPIGARNSTGSQSINGNASNFQLFVGPYTSQDFETDKNGVTDINGLGTDWTRTTPGLNSTSYKLERNFVNTDIGTQPYSAVFPILLEKNTSGILTLSFYIKSHTTITSRGMTFYTSPNRAYSAGQVSTTFKLEASQIQAYNGASYDNIQALTADTEYLVSITFDITNETYSASINSSEVITDASFLNSGEVNYLGFFVQNTATGASASEKAVVDEYTVTQSSVTITSPTNNSSFQRNRTTNIRNITVNVAYVGTPTAIEARFNGGTWSTLDASPTGGTSSGVFACQPGDGALEVRFSNDTSITDSIDIWVGEYLITAISQSNMAGHGDNDQIYSGSTSEMWKVGASAWATTADPSHNGRPSGGGGGSIIPLLGNLYDDDNIPTRFITVAVDGTALVTSPYEWQQGGSAYSAAVITIGNAISLEAETIPIIAYQGEADSKGGVVQGQWATELVNTLADIKTDTGLDLVIYVTQLSSLDAVSVDLADLNIIRKDQADSWEYTGVYPGPVMHDFDTSSGTGDGTHISSDAGLTLLAERFYHFLNEGNRGPRFSSATSSGTTVTVNFTVDSPPLQAPRVDDWRISDDTGSLSISNAVVQNNTQVVLTINRTLDTNPIISFGYGNDTAGTVFRDSTNVPGLIPANTGLPAEPFIEESVVVPTDTTVDDMVVNYTFSEPVVQNVVNVTVDNSTVNYLFSVPVVENALSDITVDDMTVNYLFSVPVVTSFVPVDLTVDDLTINYNFSTPIVGLIAGVINIDISINA